MTSMYKLFIKPLFFLFDPEKIHHFVFKALRISLKTPGMKGLMRSVFKVEHPRLEKELFGIKFPNPVGLAAGFDKDAKLYEELACLGFGFIEIGTVTPEPQPGNPKLRLFRLPDDEALINRMGFNNDGVKSAVQRLKGRNKKVIVGGNIGKNKWTPNEKAANDYEICFEALHPHVDYFVVNVSSPNTPGLRALQNPEELIKILEKLKTCNAAKAQQKPILLKIAPDLDNTDLDDIIYLMEQTKIDGLIATNTTTDKSGLRTLQNRIHSIHNSGDDQPGDGKNGGKGGLSGRPLTHRSTEVIRYLAEKSNKAFPIIGVGGIHSAQEAIEKMNAGADLIQVYTGFVYEGPSLVKKINKALLDQQTK